MTAKIRLLHIRKGKKMAKVRVAINGFGRIGRLVLRAALVSGRDDIEFVAVNDLAPAEQNAYLLEYDSVHGKLPMDVTLDGDTIVVGNQRIKCIAEKDPTKLPWGEMNIDVVMECTGIFTAADKARVHLDAGAKRVLVSAPSAGADATIVYGVNQDTLKPTDLIVSNASCTTNCLAPVAKVLDDNFGIISGWMTTVHAYTGDQQLLDKNHKDFRRARAAALSMIPTSTGAAKAVGKVIPELNGKLTGMSMRVPTLDVSVVDLTVNLAKPATYDEICAAMKEASEGELKGVLGYTEEDVVSSDFLGDTRTSIFDKKAGIQLTPTFVKVVSWYDNEIGYSNKVLDLIATMVKING